MSGFDCVGKVGAAAVIAVAVAVGCGGDDGAHTTAGSTPRPPAGERTSPSSSSGLAKAEFLERARAACRRERRTLLRELARYATAREREGMPERVVIDRMVRAVYLPKVEAEIAALRALDAPSGEERQVAAMLAANSAAVATLRRQKTELTLATVGEAFRGTSEMLRDYGIRGCASGPAGR